MKAKEKELEEVFYFFESFIISYDIYNWRRSKILWEIIKMIISNRLNLI